MKYYRRYWYISVIILIIIAISICSLLNNENDKPAIKEQISIQELEQDIYNESNNKKIEELKNEIQESEVIEEDIKKENSDSINVKEDEITNSNDSLNTKSNSNINISDESITNSTTSQSSNQTEDIKEQVQNENMQQTENIEVQTQNENIQQTEEIKTNNPWDLLGISEYDYYNKSAHSWKTVDFSIEEYQTQNETLNACKKAGDSYYETHDGYYRCSEVYSYSGRYLGEHIKYYDLES